MTHEYLKTMISDLSEIEFDMRPTEHLLALARSYVSLYNLVACNSLDEEFGDRSRYLGKIDRLFELLAHNWATESDTLLQCRMVDTMYSLVCEPLVVVDLAKKHLCDEFAAKLIDRCGEPSGLLQTGICRCLANLLYPYPAQDDAYLLLFKRAVSGWVAMLDGDCWPDVPADVALERIAVMNMNSFMLLDESHDALIPKIFSHYRNTVPVPENPEDFNPQMLPTLLRLYETAVQGNAYEPDFATAGRIADFLRNYGRKLPSGHENWLYCIACAITFGCVRLSDTMQQCAFIG